MIKTVEGGGGGLRAGAKATEKKNKIGRNTTGEENRHERLEHAVGTTGPSKSLTREWGARNIPATEWRKGTKLIRIKLA